MHVGSTHRAIKVTEVLTPFTFAPPGDTVRTAKGIGDTGEVVLTFKRGSVGTRVTLEATSYVGTQWGLAGHLRNSHKPAKPAVPL